MESVFKIKVSNTEYAAVEIRPVEDGVEIILKKADSDKPVDAPTNDKLEALRDFCSIKKKYFKNDKTMLSELKRFWEWYSPKMEDWRGKRLDAEKLWSRWTETRKGGSVSYDD